MSQVISAVCWLELLVLSFFDVDINVNIVSAREGRLWQCNISFAMPHRVTRVRTEIVWEG